jgi:glycosyltransferase involved in cell wall biosynthesis
VNNISTRALCDGESDLSIDQIMRDVEARFQPDLVHVHHLQFLSSTMKFTVPTVVTLHDEWAWCASGGLGLRDGREPCEGPSPEACAPCHAGWRPGPSSAARWMTKLAGWASPIVRPDTLHSLYKKVPAHLRPEPIRGQPATESPAAAAYRNQHLLSWFNRADARIAPSRYLADKAHRNGLESVDLVRHGLDGEWFNHADPQPTRAGIVSIGTVAYHKGTDKVVEAWREACPDAKPLLSLYGPVLDPDAALGHPVRGVLNPEEVRETLRRSRALVLGSIWPENAPLIILEARAAGCPVVAPALGGIPEILTPGVDGVLFAPNVPGALVQALKKTLMSEVWAPTPPPLFEKAAEEIEAIYRRILETPVCE